MGVRLSRGAVVVMGGVLLIGCTILTGVGDLETAALSDPDANAVEGTNESGAPVNDSDGGVALPPEADRDGSVLPPVDASTVDGCSNTGCFTMPAGFQLVTYGARGPSCPAGFGQSTDTIESATTIAGACTCACNTTQQPQCPTNGQINGFFGTGGALTCPNAGGNMANQGCGTDGYQGPFGAGNEHRYVPPAGGAMGGACTSSAMKDGSKISSTNRKICSALQIPSCNGQICPPPPNGPSPFEICIASPGDVACPVEFPTKHLTGGSTNFNCSNNCACPGVNATCTGGKLHFYASADCSGLAGLSVDVNNTCVPTVAGGASFNSHKYVANPPSNVSCINGGATNPSTVTLNQPATVCCK